MKNQRNMAAQNDHNNLPVTDPNNMEICKLPNKEFKWPF